MKMKKILVCALSIAMCLSIMAETPVTARAAETAGTVYTEFEKGNGIGIAQNGMDYCTLNVLTDEGWYADAEITECTVTSGSSLITASISDTNTIMVSSTGTTTGTATVDVSYTLSDDYSDYTDPNNGKVTLTVTVLPFSASFALESSLDRENLLENEAVSLSVKTYLYDNGYSDSNFTYQWSADCDAYGAAAQTSLTAGGSACSFSASLDADAEDDAESYCTVSCGIYYSGSLIDTEYCTFMVSKSFYLLTVSGFDEYLAQNSSCTITPELYYFDQENPKGVKTGLDTAYLTYDYAQGCTITDNGDGTYTITQTDSEYSYVLLDYSDTENGIFASWDSDHSAYDQRTEYYDRLAGQNRYETAVKVAQQVFCNVDGSTFSNIVLASGKNFPDALSGSPLAAQLNAPILLVGSGNTTASGGGSVSVNSYAYDFIAQYADLNTVIWILGGTSAVPSAVETYFTNQGYTVKRLSGTTRYDTNLAIVEAMTIPTGTDVVVACGSGYADSLSVSGPAGAKGMPIFLAAGSGLTSAQLTKIQTISPSHIYIIGGTLAVTESTQQQLADACGSSTITRVAGSNRYETSVAVAKAFGLEASGEAVMACGTNFPDGLTGGVLAAVLNAPVVLVQTGSNTVQENLFADSSIQHFYVAGGTSVVTEATAKSFAETIMNR